MNKALTYLIKSALIIGLLVLGFVNLINYFKTDKFSVLSLDNRGVSDQMVATRAGELLKGDKVWGHFYSNYRNLGIVLVRFYNLDRDSKDTLVFRLKEEGGSGWYYEARYETDQFLPHQLFPFGFPIIKNSGGKKYEFELESLRGSTGSGILIDTKNPVFIGKSSYTKHDLLNDKNLLIYFIKNKITNIFGDPEMLVNISVSFLPLVIFLSFLVSNSLSFQYLTFLTLALVIFDTLSLKNSFDLFYLSTLFLWWLISLRYRFESSITALFTLLFSVLTPTLLIFGNKESADKTAIWAYLFLLMYVVFHIYEIKRKKQGSVSLVSFLNHLFKFKALDGFHLIKIQERYIKIFVYIFSSILIYTQYAKIKHAYPKFVAFFPDGYDARFIYSILIPETVLILLCFALLVFLKRISSKSKILIITIVLMFSYISGRIISNAISFENESLILNVSPRETSEAWTDVVITGKNFRDIPFVGKVYINDIEQGDYLISWSDEKIVFRTSPFLTKSGLIEVVPFGRQPSNKVPFIYSFR